VDAVDETSSKPRERAMSHITAEFGESVAVAKPATIDLVQGIDASRTPDQFATAPSAAAQAVQTAPTQPSTDIAPIPIAGLAIEIAARAQTGRNRFEIRLDPPELGRIDVRLDVDTGGNVTSRLVVDRVETLEMLRRDAGELQRALQDAGLKTSDNGLQFTLRDQSFAGRHDRGPAQPSVRLFVPDASISETAPDYGSRIQRRGLDIRV
jgi:hypothetical protein